MATRKFGDKADASTSGASKAADDQKPAASVENGGLQREGAQPETSTTEAENTDTTLANPMGSGFSGAWSRQDVRLPRINLIHKTSKGELIEKFGIGSFALNQEVKLSDGKTPIVITALRAALDYQQKLPFGDQRDPAVYETPEEVIKHGGSLNYKDVKSGNFFQKRAHIQFVFPAPAGLGEDDLALFPYEFNEVLYGMALFTVASSAFTSVGKELATLCNNNKVMRKGMEFGRLELTSESRSKGELDWKVPVIAYKGENPEDLVKFYTGLL
jgi:hypothetical protein